MNIPEDLLNDFRKVNKNSNIINFVEKANGNLKTEAIYYKEFNVVGVFKRNTLIESGYTWVSNDYMTIGDIEIILNKCPIR